MMGDRFGSRPIMFGCGVLYLVSMLFIGIVSETWHFFIAFGVFLAITQAFTFVPLQASIGGWFRRRLGLATGLLQGAGGIGSALLAPGVAALLDAVGWRETFWFIAFLGGGLIILCSIFFRSKPADASIRPYGTGPMIPPEVTPPVESAQAAPQGLRAAHAPDPCLLEPAHHPRPGLRRTRHRPHLRHRLCP